MESLGSKISPKNRQYARLVSAVLQTLNKAVDYRVASGETRKAIAERAGIHVTALSRVLHGRVGNLTLRTISDILWSTRFEPEDFDAEAYEVIAPNSHAWAKTENMAYSKPKDAKTTPTPKFQLSLGHNAEPSRSGVQIAATSIHFKILESYR